MPTSRERRIGNAHSLLRRKKLQKKRMAATVVTSDVIEREKNPRYMKTGRSLLEVEKIHHVDFKAELARLRFVFPKKTLEVLDAGSGESTLAQELTATGITVHRSDIRSIGGPHFHLVSTNRLLGYFGRNRFHMIIETFAGTHKGGSYQVALANIYSILAPRGVAFIAAAQHPRLDVPRLAQFASEMGMTYKTTPEGIILYK